MLQNTAKKELMGMTISKQCASSTYWKYTPKWYQFF